MRRTTRPGRRTAVALSVILAVAACKSSSTSGSSTTTVTGLVTDDTGARLAGATVAAGGTTTTTAADGTFSLAVTAQSNLVVDFSMSGYLESSQALVASASATEHVAVALMKMAPAQPLDATHGGSVTGARGAVLTVGPNVLVDTSGNPVTGLVQVSLTPMSPAVPGELSAYPGALIGSTNGGPPTLLQTYGVLDVTVTQNGQSVQVASGQTVGVTIPVAAGATLPSTQDLWSFNLATGIWDYEGTAQLAGTSYTAQLAHFSYHNIDKAIENGDATCVTGLVVDASGNPVPGAWVSPSEGGGLGVYNALLVTDSNGRYCAWVTTGGTETITADSTSTPYAEGSITVTGTGASSPPEFYPFTCSNLSCQTAPNIVLTRPPCSTNADCPSGDVCCMTQGQGACLESEACGFSGYPPSSDAGGASDDSGAGPDDSGGVADAVSPTCGPGGLIPVCPVYDSGGGGDNDSGSHLGGGDD